MLTRAGAAPYAIRMPHPQFRMDLSLTAAHAERLLKLAADQGVTRSEMVRRLIDAEWQRPKPAPISEGRIPRGITYYD